MQIGSLTFRKNPIFLAPMEDVSDPPFRILCKEFGADLLYTEFISCGGLINEAEDSVQKLDFQSVERPIAIQIFGGEVEQAREAAPIVEAAGPDILDINFGCPVKKVVKRDAGAGILRNLPKMRAITDAIVENVSLPVTVKTRLGWNEDSIQIVEVAHILQDAGIQALAVHARTRSQLYKGTARWSWLTKLKQTESIRIPIIGNGDASTPEKIKTMFDTTGVDAVMVGRGAIGNPWIFRDARALIESGELPPEPSWDERLQIVARHLSLKCKWLGERKGVLEMRKMYAGYFRNFPGCSKFRRLLMEHETEEKVLEVLMNFGQSEIQICTSIAQTTGKNHFES